MGAHVEYVHLVRAHAAYAKHHAHSTLAAEEAQINSFPITQSDAQCARKWRQFSLRRPPQTRTLAAQKPFWRACFADLIDLPAQL